MYRNRLRSNLRPSPASFLALLSILAGITALTSCGGSPAEVGATNKAYGKKSIIMISLDTLRRDHMGLYGYERDTTPFLDEVAAESLVIEQAYTTMSWTLIAHMSLITGLYPQQHKVWENESALSEDVPTMAERMKAEGYYTMGFYEEPGWLDPRHGFDRGFDLYQPHKNVIQAGKHISKALADRPDPDQPFFLFIHLFDIHNAPLDPKGKRAMYDAPAPYDEMFVAGAVETVKNTNSNLLWNKPANDVAPEVHEAIVGMYDGGIAYVDAQLRSWVDEWRELGIWDDSLTIITADHGEGLHQRPGRYGGHGGTTEEGLRVPLIMRFPGGQFGGTRLGGPVSHVDVLPTMIDYLNIDKDEALVGYSLLGTIPEDRIVYAQRGQTEMMIQWPYKILQNNGNLPSGRLWNLEEDPLELAGLRHSKKPQREAFLEIAGRIREAAAERKKSWVMPGEGVGRSLTAAEIEANKGLGYGGEDEDQDENAAKPKGNSKNKKPAGKSKDARKKSTKKAD